MKLNPRNFRFDGRATALFFSPNIELVFQKTGHAPHHPVPRASTAYIDVAVVSVSAETMTPAFEFPVKVVKEYIRQQRTQRTALRRTLFRRCTDSGNHDSGVQICANQLEYALILYLLRQTRHENIMVHSVKEVGQVDVNHPRVALVDVSFCRTDRSMRAPTRTKSVAVLRKVRVEYRREFLEYGLLNETIRGSGYAQTAFAARSLWYLDALYRQWFILTGIQLCADCRPLLTHVRIQSIRRDTVHARGTLVGFHFLKRSRQVVAVQDLFHQLHTDTFDVRGDKVGVAAGEAAL